MLIEKEMNSGVVFEWGKQRQKGERERERGRITSTWQGRPVLSLDRNQLHVHLQQDIRYLLQYKALHLLDYNVEAPKHEIQQQFHMMKDKLFEKKSEKKGKDDYEKEQTTKTKEMSSLHDVLCSNPYIKSNKSRVFHKGFLYCDENASRRIIKKNVSLRRLDERSIFVDLKTIRH